MILASCRSFDCWAFISTDREPQRDSIVATRTIALRKKKEVAVMVSAIRFDGFTLRNDCALCENFEVKTSLPGFIKEWIGYCIQVCLMDSCFARYKNAIIMTNKFAGLQSKDVFVTEHPIESGDDRF